MARNEQSTRRRDVLRASAGAGLLGVTGLTVGGVTAQEETTPQDEEAGAFSFSLQEGDQFRARFEVRTPFGDPATESIPPGCHGGDEAIEYQILMVRAYRDDEDIGYRSLMVHPAVVEFDQGETTPEETPEETTPEETPAEVAADVPTIEPGAWYRVTSSEQCDGLFALTVETMEDPETTPGGVETTPEGTETAEE